MIILLNGPPNCGKDEAAKFVRKHLESCAHVKLSAPMKRGVLSLYDVQASTRTWLTFNSDLETAHLLGSTYRQEQINMFYMLQKQHGNDVLAKIALRYIKKNVPEQNIVFSDAGQVVECQALLDHYRYGNTGLISIHREGCTFEGDSREWVDIDCKYKTTIENKYDLDLYERQVVKVLRNWELIDEDD